mgnify:FL=1
MGLSNRTLTVAIIVFCALALPSAVAAQTQITDATANGGASRDSYNPNVDLDGSRIVFRSDADLLSEGRVGGDEEIWLWDSSTGFTRITDATANGGTSRDSYLPWIDNAGTNIAFRSDADLLSEGRVGGDEEIWLWNETTGLQRITDALANGGTGRDSYESVISANGNRIAFRSDADLLSEGRVANDEEIWLWDSTTGLSRITDGTANGGTGRDSYEPSLSADGTRMCFQSDADLLSEGRVANDEEIYLWDETTGLQRLTDTLANGGTGRDFYDCAISGDGTRVVFRGDGDLLSEGRAANDEEIWLWDETTGLQRLTDTLTNGATLRDAYDPEISDDGVLISFESDGDYLSTGNADGITEIWVYDDNTSSLTQVSTASASDRDSYDTGISGDGVYIAFESDSDFLAAGHPASLEEIWLFSNPIPVELMTFPID